MGVLETFIQEKPDFGRAATFFVLPAANPPNRLFNQPEYVERKLRWLVEHGYELGNHTLWHANLGKYDETVVRTQLADAQTWVQKYVPGYQFRALALPHGVYPREVELGHVGQREGHELPPRRDPDGRRRRRAVSRTRRRSIRPGSPASRRWSATSTTG